MMTVNPNYLQGLAQAISQSGAMEQTYTSELSSGQRVTQLSDDPVAAAQNVGLSSSISQLDSFVKSSTAEQSMMQVADNALGEVVSQVTSALSLAVSAGNGTLSSANLTAVAAQLSSIRDTVLSLGNTSYQGQYVFAGSQGSTKPFTLDTTTNPATVSYNGDSVTQKMETPDGQMVPVNVPGSSVFTASGASLLGTLNQLVSDATAAAAGTGSSAGIQADSTALTTALGTLSTQRATLDSSLSRLTIATTYASTQTTVYEAQQSALLSADPATVATDLSAAETQHQALLGVTATLEQKQDLFDYLK
jgi:flagellar hook-associated protein 3 FlgL